MTQDKKNDVNINMETQFGEKVDHGGWLIGPKLFRPEPYPACVSSKLCEFILTNSSLENVHDQHLK